MNLNNLLAGIAQSGIASGLAGGVAGSALTSALMSKKGRKAAKTALQIGGIAAVGGLAWKAYQSYRSTQPAAASAQAALSSSDPSVTRWQGLSAQAFEIDASNDSAATPGMLLVRAMIDASKADGHIDAREKQLIFARVEDVGLSDAEKGFLFDELTKPCSVEQIVADVKDAQTALEVYAAAFLAIDRSCEQGSAYLARLAQLLALPEPLVHEIHSQSIAVHTAAA